MKIEKIVLLDPECEWSILFDNGGALTMEASHDEASECMISMDTELDDLTSNPLRGLAHNLEAMAFMVDDLDVILNEDPGEGHTTIYIEISDGAMYELLQEHGESKKSEKWTLKKGDHVTFRFKGFDYKEFDPVILPKYDGRRARVTGQETATKVGERDFEYYNIRFSDGFELQGISGYHLQDKI
jgi:hypothetical protein